MLNIFSLFFLQAVETDHEDVIKYLLESNVNVEVSDLYGNTACDIAKILNHDNLLHILLDHINLS